MDQKTRILHDVFGYSSFRPGQDELIDAILAGRDTLGIMPTGGGKSICYQVPALALPGLTLVLSPLISLMDDQVAALRRRGVSARAISSAISAEEKRSILSETYAGRVRILYLSPERLWTRDIQALAHGVRISFVCIDESHCVSQWGREFRPAYLKIRDFIDALPERPRVAAFTATASPEVRDDIIAFTGLQNPYILTTGFDRPNLYYEVLHPRDKWTALTGLLRAYRGTCGIIYCLTRTSVEAVTKKLNRQGFRAVRYHGGLTPEERAQSQEQWIRGEIPLIVATNAFGMGIDKPDVRFVIHYNMPADPESYYQEAGRAGRDGLPSDCILLFSPRDVKICRFFISRTKNPELRKVMRRKLTAMRLYAGSKTCLRKNLLAYFGQRAPEYCGNCSVCLRTGPFPEPLLPGVESRELYADLVALRLRVAKEHGKLPYRIFSDQTLHDMAASRPVTLPDLMVIEGAGLLGCIKYGAEFVREIRAFRDSH